MKTIELATLVVLLMVLWSFKAGVFTLGSWLLTLGGSFVVQYLVDGWYMLVVFGAMAYLGALYVLSNDSV